MENRVTQCPRCSTSFRVSAAHLAVAAGAVRCGSCLHIFNALENWVDDEPARQPELPPSAASDVAEQSPREASAAPHDDHLDIAFVDDKLEAEPAEDDISASPSGPPPMPSGRIEPALGDLSAWDSPWSEQEPSEPDAITAHTEFTEQPPAPYESEPADLSLDIEAEVAAPLHYQVSAAEDGPEQGSWLQPQALIAPGFSDARIASPEWAEDRDQPASTAAANEETASQQTWSDDASDEADEAAAPPMQPEQAVATSQEWSAQELSSEEAPPEEPDADIHAVFTLDEPLSARREEPVLIEPDDQLLIDDDTPIADAAADSSDDEAPPPLISSDPYAFWEEMPTRRFDDALLSDQNLQTAQPEPAGDHPQADDERWAEQLLAEESDAPDPEVLIPAPAESAAPAADPLDAAPLIDEAELDQATAEPASGEQRPPIEQRLAPPVGISTSERPGTVLPSFEPEPLQIEQFQRQRRWPRLLWAMVLLLALLGLAGQYLYFNFAQLAQGSLRPWLARGCELAGCQLPPQLDATRIATASLVVRSHPSRTGALAVDALLTNNAPFRQPYPDLQLQFTDLHGEPVAGRRFAPDEYLGGEISPDSLMPVRQPIRIGLEIADPGPAAVNYSLAVVPFEQSR